MTTLYFQRIFNWWATIKLIILTTVLFCVKKLQFNKKQTAVCQLQPKLFTLLLKFIVISSMVWYTEMRQEYLNAVACNIPVLLQMKNWTVWYMERFLCQHIWELQALKKGPFLTHPVYINDLIGDFYYYTEWGTASRTRGSANVFFHYVFYTVFTNRLTFSFINYKIICALQWWVMTVFFHRTTVKQGRVWLFGWGGMSTAVRSG